MPPKAKVRMRLHREEARQILEDVVAGRTEDIFIAYGRLARLWNGNDPVLKELRPLFRIPGVNVCGSFSVTDEFRVKVVTLAAAILPHFQSITPAGQRKNP
jgi:hypothetical protein